MVQIDKKKQPKKGSHRYATKMQRGFVLRRDGFKCRYCDRPVTNETANIDHINPWKYGGRTLIENLVTACPGCNKLKNNRRQIEPNPFKPNLRPRHRRVGCNKPDCGVKRHHGLYEQGERVQPWIDRNYVTVPEYQTSCKHVASPNCLRQRCLAARGIPYEVQDIQT